MYPSLRGQGVLSPSGGGRGRYHLERWGNDSLEGDVSNDVPENGHVFTPSKGDMEDVGQASRLSSILVYEA